MTQISPKSHVTAIASWYGSNRLSASAVGEELAGCTVVAIPFAGGMCEVARLNARTILINDLHRAVINLARVARHPVLGPKLYRHVRRVPLHPDELRAAQERCLAADLCAGDGDELFRSGFKHPQFEPDFNWALDYFICAWMSRHGSAGTRREFDAPLSVRFNANGGDSATHVQNAARALVDWRRILRRGSFTTLDFRDFLAGCCPDLPGNGIYPDPPFFGPGDRYRHRFTERDHRDLASRLAGYVHSRIVIRYYDVPLIRELYPQPRWTWRTIDTGRKQTNELGPEVLILNGPSRSKP